MTTLSTEQALRAKHLTTHQRRFFESEDQARQWITENQGWTLQCRQEISWSFPLDQIIKQTCWVNV